FMRCALVLMGGQNGQAVGSELLIAAAALTVAGILSYRQVTRSGARVPRASVLRTLGGTGCYIAEATGAAVLIAHFGAGIYVAAVAMVANFFFMISGSWLLLVGVSADEAEPDTRNR